VLGLQKQKKPAAASQNVGAILGEAADVVVGKYANSSGPNGSQYLNRLSEIQIQDEAYIHQQLVKEEGMQGTLQDRFSALVLTTQHADTSCRASRGMARRMHRAQSWVQARASMPAAVQCLHCNMLPWPAQQQGGRAWSAQQC
jgi:hypothetical protein